jgi:uroporphyrinogen decarboxylase
MVYPENEAAHPELANQLIKSVADYRKLEPINPRKTPRMSTHIELCHKLVKAKGNDVPVVAFVFGPLGITSMLRGQADLYMDLLDDPDAVKYATQAVNATLIDYCDALIETGVHAIMLDTLFASQSIMSKPMWKEFEGYLVKDLAQHIHDKGCMVMIHNCGTGIYFDAQIEAMKPEAISFLHVPDDCSSLAETKTKYGQQTTLVGCVSPTWLPSATPAEVEDECRKEIEIMASGGGYILATGCEYPANLSFDNAKAMVNAAQKFGRYK